MNPPRILVPLLAALLGPALAAQQEGSGHPDRPMPRATTPEGTYQSFRTMESGSGGGNLVRFSDTFATRRSHVVEPRPTERCIVMPTENVWRHRDLMKEIQAIARHGLISVIPVGGDVDSLKDVTAIPSGWKAYGFTVPGNGELEVRLEHPNLGWFRLAMVNKWGTLQEGMLQNLMPKGTPVVSFKNPKRQPQQVFIIADDPGWMSSKQLPYTLVIKRNWDGKKDGPNPMPQVVGIWARKDAAPAGAKAEHGESKPAAEAADAKSAPRP